MVTNTLASTVVITGNPLGRDTLVQPASVLTGDGLALRRGGTLGDTLSGLPGVSASGFGPQSSRPVIRGLDGDRVRLLDNGGASADASNLSFDHAVSLDPLVVERIEVLRGPAALLYGGNATGGVVNTLNNRIPRNPLSGLGGRVELRLGGAAAERAAAALIEGGAGDTSGGRSGLSWHADVAERRSADLRVPRFAPSADGVALPLTTRVNNSAGDSRSGAVGASWADADGFLGAAIDGYRNRYGVTVEPDVTIHMQRERLQLAGERRQLSGPLAQIEFQFSQTRYQHQELEGSGAVGTTFRSTGREMRLQARHAPVGPLIGVLGLQAEQLDFLALGEEAFVPSTRTRSQALFVLEEWRVGDATPGPAFSPSFGPIFSAGLRVEQVQVHSDGDAADAAAPRFAAASQRRFTPHSASIGMALPLPDGWRASASLGHTERAPAYYELYANGNHVATGTFERGNREQGSERSRHAELGLQWAQGVNQFKASLFDTRFTNFIALDATGTSIESIPVYAFSGVPARLQGLEIEGRRRLAERPWAVDLSAGLDGVRGTNTASSEPLARLPPWRVRLGLEAVQGPYRVGAQLQHSASQNRVPSKDVPTPASTQLGLSASWERALQTGSAALSLLWYFKLDNLTNALVYNASALRTARELAPGGARAVTAGLRVGF